MDLEFKIGNIEDVELYREVFLDSSLYDRYFHQDDRLEKSLREALKKRELFIAMHQSEVIAVMEIRFNGFFGAFPYLALLGVKKGWRNQGVGRRMLEFYEEAARQLGYSRSSLMVSSFNPRARNLYQSLGYKKIGMLPDAFKAGIDENIMVKDL